MEPIATAVTGASGCSVSGGFSAALSVDGSAEGVFLSGVSGATGEVIVVPQGRSAARLTLGAAVFDTGLSLAQTAFLLKERPAPLGGILHVDEITRFRVSGGDATRLSVEITGPSAEGLAWVAPPRVEVACDGLGRKGRWANGPTWPNATRRVYPASDYVSVSAQKNGPVVARIAVTAAGVLETDGDWVKVIAGLGAAGTVVGWSSAADWSGPEPQPAGKAGGGGGSGRAMTAHVDCPRGTPLFLQFGDKLYSVGHLLDAGTEPRKGTNDWRLVKEGVRLDKGLQGGPDSVPWFVLRDDFRVTNAFWHDGVRGAFVVPKGPDACKPVP